MERDRNDSAQFTIAIDEYVLTCVPNGLPAMFETYVQQAALVDCINLNDRDQHCCVLVARTSQPWPFMVVAQSFSPSGGGFAPGLLLAPDTGRLFIGAGDQLLAYDLVAPSRIWLDRTFFGFWGWARHGDVVVLSAELELAAWTATGAKLWTAPVEPPWVYSVEGDTVFLDVMGVMSQFPLRVGPEYET